MQSNAIKLSNEQINRKKKTANMLNEWSTKVPAHRRYELLSVGALMVFIFFGGISLTILLLLLLIYGNIYMRALCIAYLVFYYLDINTPNRGGRGAGCEWVRNWRIWKYVIDYFPVDLVKTVDLSPDRHYVIGTCPHGILCFGVLANTITNHSKWRSLFPQIRAKMLVLVIDMLFPIFRELLLSWGLSDPSVQNISRLLSQSHDASDKSNKDGFTSNAVILSFGGAREAFLSAPNTYKVFLNARKGFVRMAIQHGAGLVPAIAFGETNVYDTQSENVSLVQKIQQIIKKYTTIAPVLFKGRGFFQQSFGLIPRRHPITLVIGEPIDCVKNAAPTNEEINDTHAMFHKRLIELFETHKSKYIENHEQVRLEII